MYRLFDIGSGAGKLGIVGALATKGRFTGVEKDRALVRIAKQISRDHKIERVRIVHGDAFGLD
jgi:precorrin-6B methylase 2